jgi:hypothetical protein
MQTRHLLAAVLEDDLSVARTTLVMLDVDPDEVRASLDAGAVTGRDGDREA